MFKPLRFVPALALALLASGCGSTEPPEQSGGAITQSGIPGDTVAVETVPVVRAAAFNRVCTAVAGEVVCQGINADEGRSERETVAGLPLGVVDLAVGRDFGCALISDGAVWCWGSNDAFQLGSETTPESTATAVKVEAVEGATGLVSGRAHSCAAADGGVWCWGSNSYGQILGAISDGGVAPTLVTGTLLSDLSSSGFETCGTETKGEAVSLVCWGNNKWGQIDPTSPAATMGPTVIASWSQASN